MSVGCLSYTPQPETKPATFQCLGWCSKEPSHTNEGKIVIFRFLLSLCFYFMHISVPYLWISIPKPEDTAITICRTFHRIHNDTKNEFWSYQMARGIASPKYQVLSDILIFRKPLCFLSPSPQGSQQHHSLLFPSVFGV